MARPGWLAPLIAWLILSVPAVAAAEPTGAAATALASGPGRPPAAGEWMEYIVAYPLDPLENSLAATPLLTPETTTPPSASPAPEAADGDDAELTSVAESVSFLPLSPPEFEAPVAWRAVPVRLAIAGETDAGLHAVITMPGVSQPIVLPYGPPASVGMPAESTVTENIRIGDHTYMVRVEQDPTPETGYIRLVNADLPFGLARFATPYVDLILVDTGRGEEPPFPSPRAAEGVTPPPGGLWRE